MLTHMFTLAYEMSCFHLRTEHVVEIIFDDHVFVIFLSLITVNIFSGGCNVIVFQPFLCTVHEIVFNVTWKAL
jgi:hypothetical protein